MKRTSWSQGLSVTADGRGVVPLAGSVGVRLLADRVGLTDRLSAALTRRGFLPGHDRGRVWVDVATMLTAGGEAIADIDTLRHQEGLLGPVASAPTVWRTLDEATPVALARVERARAKVRRHVWGLLPQLPASPVAGADLGEVVVLDVDATLVTTHSEMEQARRDVQGQLRFPPDRRLVRQHHRAAGRHVATGQRRQQSRPGPHRRPDPGHRPGPDGVSAAAAGPGRRGRRHP